MKPPKFAVHKRATTRLDGGHPWVFANELDVPAKSLPEGGVVDVTAPDGRFLGRGYANPGALIAVRICTRDKGQHLDLPGFWASRLRAAVSLREAVLGQVDACRLVHGEADGIPGLVLDRYGPVVVAQATTLGMQQRLPMILEALHDVLPDVEAGVLRHDTRARTLEGLDTAVATWFGEPPEQVDIDELGVRFRVSPTTGPRTGHHYEQRDNRAFAGPLCTGRTVLDVFAGTGGWGLHALFHGAEQVVFVDKDVAACEAIDAHLDLNGFDERGVILNDQAEKTLEALVAEGHRFGAVVLDPPPFAKTKKEAGSGLRGYRELNTLALHLVEPGGYLFTSSRSRVVFEERFLDAIAQAAQKAGKVVRLLRRGESATDHPLLPALPETRTLKHLAFQVLPQW